MLTLWWDIWSIHPVESVIFWWQRMASRWSYREQSSRSVSTWWLCQNWQGPHIKQYIGYGQLWMFPRLIHKVVDWFIFFLIIFLYINNLVLPNSYIIHPNSEDGINLCQNWKWMAYLLYNTASNNPTLFSPWFTIGDMIQIHGFCSTSNNTVLSD